MEALLNALFTSQEEATFCLPGFSSPVKGKVIREVDDGVTKLIVQHDGNDVAVYLAADNVVIAARNT